MIDGLANSIAGVEAAGTARQSLIIPGVIMADGGDCGGDDGAFIKGLPSGCTTYSTAATRGGVRGDRTRLCGRTAREEFPDGIRPAGGQISVLFGSAHLPAHAPGRARPVVPKTFFFGSLECGFLDQDALALVAAQSTAEADDHSRKGTVLPGSSCERCVAAGQVDEMIEIGAPQAQRSFEFHEEETALPQFVAALATLRFTEDREDYKVFGCRMESGIALLSRHAFNVA
jgi:hypothetical protein